MYELIQAAPNTYYIQCPTKIGIYRESDDKVWLIDSGNDKEAGRKVARHLEAQGWKAAGIINTHSNADHIGGNEMVSRRMGCPIYSTIAENSVIQHTLLEPSLLYGGYPPKALQNKFLMAHSTIPNDIADASLPAGMEIFPLPGHFIGMIGVKTPDDVYFLADALFGEDTLQKYHVSYIYDLKGFFETLDMLETLEGKLFIPSHCPETTNIQPLIAANRQKALEIIGRLLEICQIPCNFDKILQQIFNSFQLTMDMNQYALVGSCIRSYLSYLVNQGKMEMQFQDNILTWKSLSMH